MKVLLLAPFPPPVGGIATWATNLCATKLSRGWEIIPLQTNFPDSEVYQNINKRNYFLEIKRCFWIWRRLKKALILDQEIKVVHSNIPANTQSMLREIGCALITKILGREFVVHYHCTLPQKINSRLCLNIFRILNGLAGNVFVLNKTSEKYACQYTKANVFCIPNFVEQNIIRTEDKVISKKVKKALYVGGIVSIKGCDIILKAAESFPEIEFRLVGFISDEFKTKEIPSNVTLTGVKSGADLRAEFENADLFLFLSYMDSEGFSIALTEAMAYGLPCVATDWAANKDMLEDKGGHIVPIKNVEATVSAISAIDSDFNFRKSASKRNVDTVKKHYSQSVVPELFVDAYLELMKRNGKI